MEKYLKKYYQLFFLAVAILLLYPTLQKGYIFLLDWSVTPNVILADINFQVDSLVTIISRFGSIVLTFFVWQRIYLLVTVLLLGLAGFRLAKRTGNVYARYFAGLFLIFNPFSYARLVEQSGILLGCVFFFWFLIHFLEYLEKKESGKKILVASIFSGLAIATFAHSLFFVGMSTGILLFFDFLKTRDWKFALKTVAIILGVFFILNANWIIAYACGVQSRISGVGNFTQTDLEAFETSGINDHSIYLTVLALQGYWGEYQERFVSIQENPLWSAAFLLIFGLAILGLVKIWKKDRFAKPLVVIFLLTFVLAIGIASPLFKPLALWLYQQVPLYIGLREPQKWVAVMLFVYAYLGSWGVKYFQEMGRFKNYRLEIGVFCVLLPVIFSFSAIRGMHEKLTPHEFPSEWQEGRDYLINNKVEDKILLLPWHSYMELDFAGKNIIVPQQFFGKNIIRANNTEFGRVYSHSLDEQTLAIEKYIQTDVKKEKVINYGTFAGDMEKIDIRFVILLKAEDWQKYLWLDRIGMRKVLENTKLIIYALQ